MEIVRVSKTPITDGEKIENIGWVEKKSSGILILNNVNYLDLIKDENSVKGDNIVTKTGDYILVSRCSCEKHVVKPMETIEQIAKKNNLKVDYLVETNSLKSKNLFIGQILKL